MDKKNKVPGCDRLTRPEEIEELKKYLRKVKDVQEEYVENEFNNLEAPGITTGLFPKVNELPETVVELDTKKNIENLYNTVHTVPGNKNQNLDLRNNIEILGGDFKELELGREVEKIEDQRKINLNQVSEKLVGEFKTTELEDRVERIQDNQEVELNKVSEKLDGEFKNPELMTHVEKIKTEEVSELYDAEYSVPDNQGGKVTSLGDQILKLHDSRNTELRDKVEGLKEGEFKEPGLTSFIDELDDNRNTELENKIENLKTGAFKNLELEDRVESLSEDKEVSELYDSEYSVPNNQGGEVSWLYESVYATPDNQGGEIKSLEDNKEKLEGIEEVDNLSKYEKIFKVLDDIEERDGVNEYINKLRSLISAYLVNDSINQTQAQQYLDKLQGCFIEYHDEGLERLAQNNPEGDKRLYYIDNNEDPENIRSTFKVHQNLEPISKKLDKKGGDTPIVDGTERIKGDYNYLDVNYNPAEYPGRVDQARKVFNNKIKKNALGIPGLSDKIPDSEYLNDLIDNQPRVDQEYDFINNSNDSYISEKADQQFRKHQNLEKIAQNNPGEARETDRDYDFIGNNEDPNNIESTFKLHQNLEEMASVNSGEARETDGDYDFIGESENKARQHIGAREDGTKVKSGTYLRPYYELPFLSELRNGTAVSANLGNTLSSFGVNDMGVTNINSYIRQIAEWVGDLSAGTGLREMLINETLHLLVALRRQLEVVTNANKDRLPGNNNGLVSSLIQGGISGAINSAIDAGINAISARPETDQPLNRPRIDTNGERNTTPTTAANNRVEWSVTEKGESGLLLKKIGQNFVNSFWSGEGEGFKNNYTEFKSGYMLGQGIYTTLMDLCGEKNPGNIESVESLKDLLKKSPYITTPSKFGTIQDGLYRTTTLDTNSNWEIILEPFCSDTMNGGFSYLPAIQEINTENYYRHGVITHYNKWIPFINFSLQKSRLNSKTLGLFDGEISYPVSAELTNELRLTIVDDQYKSWRHYFQKCMDVSVYNSQAHGADYYEISSINKKTTIVNTNLYFENGSMGISTTTATHKTSLGYSVDNDSKLYIPTAVDKSNICVAFYKNITFRIRIYVMTPQFSTIRKFDLLCVLKDFTEEYEGDIDAPGPDLNLVFSVVGENPDNNIEKVRQEKLNWEKFDNSQNKSIEYYHQVTSISPTSTTLINVIQ